MKTQTRKLLIVAVLAAAAVLTAACASAPAVPGQSAEHAITVSGRGEASGAPDIATVELGIEVTNTDIDAAVEEANATMEAVRAAIEEAGVAPEDMQTHNFRVSQERMREPLPEPVIEESREEPEAGPATSSVQPPEGEEAQDQQPQQQVLYHVSNTLRITVHEIDNVSTVIGAGLDAGANNVRDLRFSIEDTSDLEATARQRAIDQANERAQQLADELGVELGDPIAIREGGAVPPQPVRIEAEAMAADTAGAAPPISEGQLTVGVSITVSYEIK